MNEMTDDTMDEAGPKAKGKGKNAGKAEASSIEAEVSRLLVRGIWMQEWMAANPSSKPEDRKVAWQKARTAEMAKKMKVYRKALVALKRYGLVMSIIPTAVTPADEDVGADA